MLIKIVRARSAKQSIGISVDVHKMANIPSKG